MVKPLAELTCRAIQASQALEPHLLRIRHGFMATDNIQKVEESLRTMQKLIDEMRLAVAQPPRSQSFIPSK